MATFMSFYRVDIKKNGLLNVEQFGLAMWIIAQKVKVRMDMRHQHESTARREGVALWWVVGGRWVGEWWRALGGGRWW